MPPFPSAHSLSAPSPVLGTSSSLQVPHLESPARDPLGDQAELTRFPARHHTCFKPSNAPQRPPTPDLQEGHITKGRKPGRRKRHLLRPAWARRLRAESSSARCWAALASILPFPYPVSERHTLTSRTPSDAVT